MPAIVDLISAISTDRERRRERGRGIERKSDRVREGGGGEREREKRNETGMMQSISGQTVHGLCGMV